MMTFVQAAYVPATFVHISDISAVIDPILTKLFGPNILGALTEPRKLTILPRNRENFSETSYIFWWYSLHFLAFWAGLM